jgi:hypothetical protein
MGVSDKGWCASICAPKKMRFAVVIGVGRGPGALASATATQALLLNHMGDKLGSIRVAVPRLLRSASIAAIADRPDALVIVGGPRTARKAAQVALKERVPVLFLPGARLLQWAKPLWGALPLETMIAALAREDVKPTRIGVGMAGEEIFFGEAQCGVLPQLSEIREAFRQAEALSDGMKVLARIASLGSSMVHPGVRIRCNDSELGKAAALVVTAHGAGPDWRRSKALSCTAWKHSNPIAHANALIRTIAGADWRRVARVERFECDTLSIDARTPWILLDEDPVWFAGQVPFRFLPDALETFVFRGECKPPKQSRSGTAFPSPARLACHAAPTQWNFAPGCGVAMDETALL